MTYGIRDVVAVTTSSSRKGFFGTSAAIFGSHWNTVKLAGNWTLQDVWTYTFGCHIGHSTEFFVALLAYWLFFWNIPWQIEYKEFKFEWVGKVFAFNFVCEVVLVGFWHWLVYASNFAKGVKNVKFNPANQYEKISVNLYREIFYTSLGWAQSATWQVLFMWLWANKLTSCYTTFWSHPLWSVSGLVFITFWREIHFYWCHRCMHPWFDMKLGLMDGDVGAFLYRYAHSLHHKSYNPGPWSGLSMHPLEHFLYYSV